MIKESARQPLGRIGKGSATEHTSYWWKRVLGSPKTNYSAFWKRQCSSGDRLMVKESAGQPLKIL